MEIFIGILVAVVANVIGYLICKWLDPVSYTHLDVYKRQEVTLPNGAITKIVTAPTGFLSCANLCGYIAGRLLETDVELRKSYVDKIFNRSSRMTDSIRSAILTNCQGVTAAEVYENRTNKTDDAGPVSYTHLDVYKRQVTERAGLPAPTLGPPAPARARPDPVGPPGPPGPADPAAPRSRAPAPSSTTWHRRLAWSEGGEPVDYITIAVPDMNDSFSRVRCV